MSTQRARLAQRTLLGAWALLAAVLVAWLATLASVAGRTAVVLFVLLPLALPVRGMLLRRRATLRWAPLTLVPALAWALTEIIASPAARAAAAATLAAILAAFAALLAALRTSRQS